MKLSLTVWLFVGLLASAVYSKRERGGGAGHKIDTDRRKLPNKLKLPGRTVVVPFKREHVATTVVKGFATIGKDVLKGVRNVRKTVALLNRDIKAYFSSDFEMLLLRMTAPTDVKTTEADLAKFLATTKTFIYNDDVHSESNTYRVTLRKLWSKITERDSRTVMKALHILHILLMNSKVRDASVYKRLFSKMSKEFDRKTRSRYFSTKGLCREILASDENKQQCEFVKHFFHFVTMRGKGFAGKYDELMKIDFKMKEDDILSELNKAANLVDAALACKVGLEADSEVVMTCLSLVARDLRNLFELYGAKVKWVLNESEVGDLFDSWEPDKRSIVLAELKDRFESKYDRVKTFLAEIGEQAELYGEDPAVTLRLPDNLQD